MCGTHLSSIVKPQYNSLWEVALLALAQCTNLSQTLFPLTLPASGHYQATFKFVILVFLDTVWVRLHSRHPSVPGLFHLGYHHVHSYCFKWSAQYFKESIKKTQEDEHIKVIFLLFAFVFSCSQVECGLLTQFAVVCQGLLGPQTLYCCSSFS